MPLQQARCVDVTQVSNTDGNDYTTELDRQGGQIVTELHGKYYQWAYRGRLFWGRAAAAAIPVASATALTNFVLWNPANSGKNATLVRLMEGWNATTEAPGNVQLAFATGVGSNIGTGAPVSAFAAGTVNNALIGLGTASAMKFGTTATLAAAGTAFGSLGMSHLTTTGTATFGSFMYMIDFDGMAVVPPGVLVYPIASTATASTYDPTLIWYESPL